MGILIVDDAREIRKMLAHVLRKSGYENLEFAESGKEAIQLVDDKIKAREEIDLILLDVVMRGIGGIEVCRRLKRRDKIKDVPIIMVTGKEDSFTLQEAFSAGATDYITKPFSRIELEARVGSALRLRKEIKHRNKREQELKETARKLEKANRKLEQMASIDSLTGLANRRLFDEALIREWKRARRKQETLGLLLVDIDHFKPYNDAYGHQAGDKCLEKIGDRLTELVVRPADLVARYGGEEFAVILPSTDLKGTLTVAERIRSEIEAMGLVHRESPVGDYVTVSIGAAIAKPGAKERKEKLVRAADKALYQAKESGRNEVRAAEEMVN